MGVHRALVRAQHRKARSTTMRTTMIAAAAILLVAANAAKADSDDWRPEGHDTAVAACLDFNQYKPANLDSAAEDGLGDWIVWVKDKDGDLWLCNANKDGDVYANVLLNGDMLDGEGSQLVSDENDGGRRPGPAESAERLCAAVGSTKEELEIVATVDDALGDYLVWLKNKDDAYWMCNASSDDKLYTFQAVQYPIEEQPASDDATCCETDENRQS
jgi:hypothetical protein